MSQSNFISVHIISDSLGRTGRQIVDAVLSQFPTIEVKLTTHALIRQTDQIYPIFNENPDIIVHTLVVDQVRELLTGLCKERGIPEVDLIQPLTQHIAHASQQAPQQNPGAKPGMDQEYFKKIEAIEFAVTNDDGKNPSALTEADLILLGPSRTSKTPLSIYLANLAYKSANLPLLPEVHLPDLIWEIDPKRIVGLTNDIDILMKIRQERMLSYGITSSNLYANHDRILEELTYCHEIYDQLGCLVINVSNKSIEETATEIINHLSRA